MGYESDGVGKVAADVADRFGANDEFGVRLNTAYVNGDTAIDDEQEKLGLVSLGLDYRGDRARVSADLGWQNNELDETRTNVTLSGVSRVPSAPDSDSNWAQPWTFSNEKDLFGTLRGEYDILDNVTAYAAYGARKSEEENSLGNLTVTDVDGTGSFYRFDNNREDTVQTGELGLKGDFTTGSVDHDWVISGNIYDHEEKGAYIYDFGNSQASDLYDPTYYDSVAWTGTAVYGGDMDNLKRVGETTMSSVAIGDTLSMFDGKFDVMLGARYQKIETASYDYNTQAKTSEYDDDEVTPSLGLVYKPNYDLSFYANYIESLQKGDEAPTTVGSVTVANAGTLLAPYVSKQTEVGVKYDNGSVGAGVAVFHTKKPRTGVNSDNVYEERGENVHQGVELSVFGSPADNMRFIGGFSYLDTEQKDTGDSSLEGNRVVGVPEFQANVGVEYDLASLEGLTLTGDVIHTGSRYADVGNTLKVDGFTTLDLGARYKMKLGGQDVTLRGMVENVLDEDYWESVGGYTSTASNTEYGYLNAGDPRTFKVSATFDF